MPFRCSTSSSACLVHHAAAREIDQVGGGLHGGEHVCADDAARLRRERRQQHEVVELRHRLDQLVARRPCGRSDGSARGAELMPTTCMPSALHFGASASAITPMPKMPTVLPLKQARRPASPVMLVLIAHEARHIAAEREHRRQRRLRHRRAVDAVHVGDDHVLPQRRQVDQVVDAAAERLDPLQGGAVAHHLVGHHRREGEQRIGGRDVRCDLGAVIEDVDGQLAETPAAAGRDRSV